LSIGHLLSKSCNEGIQISRVLGESSVKGSFKSSSSGITRSIAGIGELGDKVGLSGSFFGNTFHGPVDGTLDEFIEVLDVLDVKSLSVGKDIIVVLNGNSLSVSGVSVS
jgi:hypothetical protein